MSKLILDQAEIINETILLERNKLWKLPFDSNKFDTIVTFNSLEHLHPLEKYIIEIIRVLRPGGFLVGGIPCEGGFAWGLGRFLTTRRFVMKKYRINYDKIICWEHPNYADFIFRILNKYFKNSSITLHPFKFLSLDFNLMASFICEK
jgi:SAM-dependent methyltransferase